jgi:hypothetical protein
MAWDEASAAAAEVAGLQPAGGDGRLPLRLLKVVIALGCFIGVHAEAGWTWVCQRTRRLRASSMCTYIGLPGGHTSRAPVPCAIVRLCFVD